MRSVKMLPDVRDVSRAAGDRWYVTNGVTAVGPVKFDLLTRGIEAGKVPIESFIRHEAWTVWKPLTELAVISGDAIESIELPPVHAARAPNAPSAVPATARSPVRPPSDEAITIPVRMGPLRVSDSGDDVLPDLVASSRGAPPSLSQGMWSGGLPWPGDPAMDSGADPGSSALACDPLLDPDDSENAVTTPGRPPLLVSELSMSDAAWSDPSDPSDPPSAEPSSGGAPVSMPLTATQARCSSS